MNSYLKVLFFSFFFVSFVMATKFDPSVMASLSKLPIDKRERLMKQYGLQMKDNSAGLATEKRNSENTDAESSKIQERKKNPVRKSKGNGGANSPKIS